MLLDLSPLKVSRDYRLLFFGQLVSFFGSMMTFIVVPWHMYQLTESSAMVGYIYLAEFVPMFVLAFVGGALADYFEKRRLLRLTEFGQAFTSAVLLINSLLPQPRDLGPVCLRRTSCRAGRDTAAGVRIVHSKGRSCRSYAGGDGIELDQMEHRCHRQPVGGRRGRGYAWAFVRIRL